MTILEQLFTERNSSKSTQITYTRSCRYYEKITKHSITECLEIADDEEYNNIRWKNTQTRKWILEYRDWLYHKYNVSTAQLYLSAILTIYRHFEITIPPLPYYSMKNLKKTPPINYKDLPDREILSECLQIASPLVRAIILFMSSSGVSRIDFIIDKDTDKIYANEINSIPGSLSFYLFKPLGMEYKTLLDRLIKIAIENYKNEERLNFSFDNNLLA